MLEHLIHSFRISESMFEYLIHTFRISESMPEHLIHTFRISESMPEHLIHIFRISESMLEHLIHTFRISESMPEYLIHSFRKWRGGESGLNSPLFIRGIMPADRVIRPAYIEGLNKDTSAQTGFVSGAGLRLM
jgi:hypothetical protein